AFLLLAAQAADDALHLLDLLVADALAAAVAALQAVQDVLPHRQRRLQAARPVAAPLQLPAEVPLLREPLDAQEAPLPRLRVRVSPLDLDRHRPPPRPAAARRTPAGRPAAASPSAAAPA